MSYGCNEGRNRFRRRTKVNCGMSLKQQDDVLMYEEVFRLLQEADAAMQPGERRNFMRSEFNGWQMMDFGGQNRDSRWNASRGR